jgi:hypothetical protein
MSRKFNDADRREYLRKAKIVEMLPGIFASDENRPVPAGLVGAAIIAIGTFDDRSLVGGGGLAIDYQPPGSTTVRRAVFAFDETAMWCEELEKPDS